MVLGLVVVKVPPHVLTPPLLATVNPVGSTSVKASPFNAVVFGPGFVMVNCNEVVVFSGMDAGLKSRPSVGGCITLVVAVLLVAPVPPSLELIVPVVFAASPGAVPFTCTLKVHEELWVTVPLDRLIVPVPAMAVTVPLHVLLTLGVLDTTRIPVTLGSVSLNATPVRSPAAVRFGLLMVKVRVEVEFSAIPKAGLNALLMVGGATTVMVALPVLPAPPLVEPD